MIRMKKEEEEKKIPENMPSRKSPVRTFRTTQQVENSLVQIMNLPGFPRGQRGVQSCAIRYAINHFIEGKRAVDLKEADGLIKCISENREPLQKSLYAITAANADLRNVATNINDIVKRLLTINKMINKSGDKQLLADFVRVMEKLTKFQDDIDAQSAKVVEAHERSRVAVSSTVQFENEILRRALMYDDKDHEV